MDKMSLPQIDKINRYYQSTAEDYQEFWMGDHDLAMHFGYYDDNIQTHSESLEKMNEVLARLASISLKDRVLDAGCGFGGSALWLAENIGCQVEGINVVKEQLEAAQKFATKRSLSNLVHFSHQNYLMTSFPDNSFNIVWALESILHAESREIFLTEVSRLLKKDGRLLIAEYMVTESLSISAHERMHLRNIEDNWEIPSLLTFNQYKTLLKNIGFASIKSYDLTEHVRPSIKRLGNICQGVLTCSRRITPSGGRESNKINLGDSSNEKEDIYGRANRRDFTWI